MSDDQESGPWDNFAPPATPAQPSVAPTPDYPWEMFPNQQDKPVSPDLASKIYRPLLEGGATQLGGLMGGGIGTLADAVLGPAGTIGGALAGAAAGYPAGKYLADAIDKIRGVAIENQSLPKQMLEGAETELGGQALGAMAKPLADTAGGVLSKLLPNSKMGEAVSGTPASNLSRAFKNGFVKTFLSPMSVEEAGENYQEQYMKLMGDHFTPEQQADLLLNPNGIAKENLGAAIQKAITGQPISAQEAIAARQGISQLMPSQTAKSLPRVKGFSDFRSYLNDIIGKEAPEFKQASDDYAAAKLRDQLLKFGRVNKTNPEEYSKLGELMFGILGTSVGLGEGSIKKGAVAFLSQGAASPFVMGLVSAASGSTSRAAAKALENPLIQRAASAALDDYFNQNDASDESMNRSRESQ